MNWNAMPSRRAALAVVAVCLALFGCTRNEVVVGGAESNGANINSASATTADDPTTADDRSGQVGTSTPSSVVAPATTVALSETEAFCGAWGRWEQSVNMVLAGWVAAVGRLGTQTTLPADGQPAESVVVDIGAARVAASEIEVSASATMVAAYYEMGVGWPVEIEQLKEPALAAYDALFQRAKRSLGALEGVGTTPAQSRLIAGWWESEVDGFDGSSLPTMESAPPGVQIAVQPAAQGVAANESASYQEMAAVSADAVTALYEWSAVACSTTIGSGSAPDS